MWDGSGGELLGQVAGWLGRMCVCMCGFACPGTKLSIPQPGSCIYCPLVDTGKRYLLHAVPSDGLVSLTFSPYPSWSGHTSCPPRLQLYPSPDYDICSPPGRFLPQGQSPDVTFIPSHYSVTAGRGHPCLVRNPVGGLQPSLLATREAVWAAEAESELGVRGSQLDSILSVPDLSQSSRLWSAPATFFVSQVGLLSAGDSEPLGNGVLIRSFSTPWPPHQCLLLQGQSLRVWTQLAFPAGSQTWSPGAQPGEEALSSAGERQAPQGRDTQQVAAVGEVGAAGSQDGGMSGLSRGRRHPAATSEDTWPDTATAHSSGLPSGMAPDHFPLLVHNRAPGDSSCFWAS